MEATCHLRGPRKSVDFWGADRLGGAQTKWGGGRWNFNIYLLYDMIYIFDICFYAVVYFFKQDVFVLSVGAG